MVQTLQQAGAWIGYRLIRAFWWIRRPVILGVRVLVVRNGRVLLVRHSYRSRWFLPGGRPNRGESLADTARREAREEVGVQIDEVNLLGVYSRFEKTVSDHVVVFRAECLERDGTRSKEIRDDRWFEVDNLPDTSSIQTQRVLDDWKKDRVGRYRVV